LRLIRLIAFDAFDSFDDVGVSASNQTNSPNPIAQQGLAPEISFDRREKPACTIAVICGDLLQVP
jgi:hypothetical protein